MAVVPEDEMVDTLVEWAEFIDEHGVDAALERGRSGGRGKEAAEADRPQLFEEQGDDANDTETIIREIRRKPESAD